MVKITQTYRIQWKQQKKKQPKKTRIVQRNEIDG